MTARKPLFVAIFVAVAAAVWAAPMDAQPLRQDFRWVSVTTWCLDGSPGTNLSSTFTGVAGSYQISQEERNRDCRLRIVWELEPRHQGTAYGQALMNRIHPPRRQGQAISGGPPERVLATLTPTSPGQWHTQAEIRLRDLQLPARIGMRVPYQAGGDSFWVYANPYFRDFAPAISVVGRGGGRVGGRVERTPTFRITSLRLNDGARSTTSPTVALRMDHAGAQATHYQVSENPNFAGARWHPYAPTYGGSQPIYTFQNRDPGQKRLFAKLRSGTGTGAMETDVESATIDYAPVLTTRCQLEYRRADNALSGQPSSSLGLETLVLSGNETRTFDSRWPSDNEKRRGYGMHVREVQSVSSNMTNVQDGAIYITWTAVPLAPRTLPMLLLPGNSREVRSDFHQVKCLPPDGSW